MIRTLLRTRIMNLKDVLKLKSKRMVWEKVIQNVCKNIDNNGDLIKNYILKSYSIKKYYILLRDERMIDRIYYDFVVALAVELSDFDLKKQDIIYIGSAILDNWFGFWGIDYIKMKNQLVKSEINESLGDKERLYREYFIQFDDLHGKDIIRIYYPKNGQNWIDWKEKNSLDIKVNLKDGVNLGFCKIGFSDSLIENKHEKILRMAYVENDKEILLFDHQNLNNISEKNIIWTY